MHLPSQEAGLRDSSEPRFPRRIFLASLVGLAAGVRELSGRGLSGLEERAVAALGGGFPVVVSRDELSGTRALAGGERLLVPQRTPRFNLLGLHWRGEGNVWLRALSEHGEWTPWEQAVAHELPDPGSRENRRPGWRLGTPIWVGPSTAVEYRVSGRVFGLRAHYVLSPRAPTRRLAAAERPDIIDRSGWGANEKIVRGSPEYAKSLVLAVVHHTAGASPSSSEESAQVVRGIQAYHVKANGWDDIGYNFLVDPFGQIFEGRRGGIAQNVVGAHAYGANRGSVGVALLGNYQRDAPTAKARRALGELLAWRLDVAHLDPLSLVTHPSGRDGWTLRAISGHRDVNSTACPGGNLYSELDALARDAAALGLPKLYEPRAEVEGRTVRFTARLSEPRAWTVAVAREGEGIARGEGSGTIVDWSWDSGGAPSGRYRYTIGAGPAIRPAAGSLRLPSGAAGDQAQLPPPPRPGSVPRRIPRWAWETRAWHLLPPAERGPRPAGAPRPLPRWYWEWRAWLASVERWRRKRAG